MQVPEFLKDIKVRPIFPDFILGIGLCFMMCGVFFLDTSHHRLVMYLSLIPAVVFMHRQSGWLTFFQEKNILYPGCQNFFNSIRRSATRFKD